MSSLNLVETLKALCGADHVCTDAKTLAPFLVDTRKRYFGKTLCMVRPANTEEVSAVVRACAEAGVAIVPQGGNTGHCGAATPDPDGNSVLVNLSRMNTIRQIDVQNNTMTVEAGCVLQNIQTAAEAAGRLFPLSLAAQGSCQIGGNLSTNAGGVQVLRYGNARELTLGLEVVLPDGQIWHGLRGLRKDNTGYDLKQLFIGGEGTLGIITAAVMKLFPLPKGKVTAWLAIESPQMAVAMLNRLQAVFGANLTACELISDISLCLVLQHIPQTRAPLAKSPWHLLVELSDGKENSSLQENMEAVLASAMEDNIIQDAAIAQSGEQAKALWKLRESISDAQKADGPSIKHDISLPISRLPEFVKRCDSALEKAFPGIRIVTFGHVGDGNLHYNQSRALSSENEAFMKLQPQVNRLVHDMVHEMGGSISAEHGVGQLKRDELLHYKSAVEIQMMQAIKRALDPKGIMNPGKMLNPE